MATIDDLTIRFERRLGVPLERAWRAVTDPDEMRAWFPSAVVGERRVGASLSFPFDENVADTFSGEVVEWAPPHVFAFTWNGDLLRIALSPDGADATRLVFTQTLQHRTEAARTSSGWHQCLAALDAHLGGPPADPETWKTVYSAYLQRMDPPMAERDGNGVTFDRMHFAAPDSVREQFADTASWGGDVGADLRVEQVEHGTRYRVHVPRADAETAARWHGMLTQLDMKLASGQLVVDDGWRERIPDYEKRLA
jgi:uncharacterized protein YndB with AHSA1/START domain